MEGQALASQIGEVSSPAKTASSIERELCSLSGELQHLSMVVDELEKRLASVLRNKPEPGEQEDSVKKDTEPLSPLPMTPLAERIKKFKLTVNRIGNRLTSIKARVEL